MRSVYIYLQDYSTSRVMKKLIAIYSILIGITVPGMWYLILSSGINPEGPIRLGFHLYTEFTMAILCLLGGILLLKNKPLALDTLLVGHAMLVYSALNTAGCYGERGQNLIMVVFIALFVSSVVNIMVLFNMLIRKELDKKYSI